MIHLSKETKAFILEHGDDDVFTLAFRAGRYPLVDMSVAINQIEGRQKIKSKLPTWYANREILYPRHLPLEQCSSEKTALYKARLVKGTTLIDLTGGMGIDTSFLSRQFEHVVYVEQQKELCELAEHNFQALGLEHIDVVNADSITFLEQTDPVDVIYIDPARRDETGAKTFAIGDCEPNIIPLEKQLLTKARTVLVKLSPMLDAGSAIRQLEYVTELYIVSVGNECKEMLVVLNKRHESNPAIHCVNITAAETQDFLFDREGEMSATCDYSADLQKYLYEPNASILKAGAYKSIAQRFKLLKLHPNSHLYTSDNYITNFPGRVFEIAGQSSFAKKELSAFLRSMKKANITVRNFPVTALELHKRLHLLDGGEDYLFATTLANGRHVIIHGKKCQN